MLRNLQRQFIKKKLLLLAIVIVALIHFHFIWLVENSLHAMEVNPLPAIIFVARSHLATQDRIFKNERGPAGQFGTGLAKFAPGSKLVRRNADGSLFVYELN